MKNSYKHREELCKSKQSTRNRTMKMLQVYAGSVKDLISQKYKWLKFLQGWSDCLENLTRQRHDRGCRILLILGLVSLEGKRSFRGFRSRNGSKLPNDQQRSTNTEREALGEAREGFGKKTARTTFSSTPNIRKLILWSAEPELIQFWRRRR